MAEERESRLVYAEHQYTTLGEGNSREFPIPLSPYSLPTPSQQYVSGHATATTATTALYFYRLSFPFSPLNLSLPSSHSRA